MEEAILISDALSGGPPNKKQRKNRGFPRMPGLSIPRNIFAFPDKIITQLRYAEFDIFTSTSGGAGGYKYRANAIYDPNYTSTGHQPLYRDEYAAIYNHYTVIHSKIEVTFINQSDAPWVTGIVIDDDTSSATGINILCEQNHAKSFSMTAKTGSLSHLTITEDWGSVEILNTDPYLDGSNKIAVGADPDEISMYSIFGSTMDGSTNNMYFKVEILYDVIFSELKTPTGS